MFTVHNAILPLTLSQVAIFLTQRNSSIVNTQTSTAVARLSLLKRLISLLHRLQY